VCALACAQQAVEKPKSCEFKEAGLRFQSKLIRSQDVLIGYEVKIKNIGEKVLSGFEHPLLAQEAAYATIYESPPGRGSRSIVSAPLRIYPMHVSPEMQQKRFLGPLRIGEEKTFFVKIEEAFRDGYPGKVDYSYDFRIGFDFMAKPSDIPYSEAVSRYSSISSRISFSGCLSFSDVRLNEPSGK